MSGGQPCLQGVPCPAPRYDRAVPRQYVHVDARTISYFDSEPAGNARRVLVLLHAFPLGAGMWEGQVKALPPGWRLIAPDLRGFGGSTLPEPDDSASMDDYATDVLDVLRELGITSAVIGGCSMGGYATFALLRRAPATAEGLVLIDTRAGADTPEGRANRRSMLALLEREGPLGVARDMLPKLLGTTTCAERPEVEPLVRRLIKGQSAAAIRGAILRMMQRPDAAELLPSLRVPALVVVGEEDVLTPPAEAQKLADGLPDAELVVMPRTGHLPNLERPQAFNEILHGFLARL